MVGDGQLVVMRPLIAVVGGRFDAVNWITG